jgi:lipopolysaccharide transport system ATP-binding protein
LLVDEVLAVGDIGFQRKCLGKMQDECEAGRTILFVSHNMAMIEALCSRAILLRDSKKEIEGPTTKVIAAYMNDLRAYWNIDLRDRVDRKGTGKIRFAEVMILDTNGNEVTQIPSGQDCIISMNYETAQKTSVSGVTFAASFYSRGVHLFSINNALYGESYDDLPPVGKVMCRIPSLPLAPGVYQFNLMCRIRGVVADWITEAGELVVSEGDFFGTGQLPPSSHPGALVEHSWSIQPL